MGARHGAKIFTSSDWSWRLQRRIEFGNYLSSLIACENQHLVNLKQTDATDQRNEHGHARQEQANDYQDTDERNPSGTVPVDASERRHRVEKSSGKYPKCMRHYRIPSKQQHQTWGVGSSAELHHYKGQGKNDSRKGN